jgi:cytochrome b6-f complex iron-sulfur subunit
MKTRREFITCSGCALLAIGCGAEKAEKPIEVHKDTGLEPVDDDSFDPCNIDREEDWVELQLSAYPELQEVGGYVTTNLSGNSIIIAHVSEGCFAAVSSVCTHEGGSIFYSQLREQFSCQLHAATFNLDGEWALGQVASNLKSFLVAREGEILWIQV